MPPPANLGFYNRTMCGIVGYVGPKEVVPVILERPAPPANTAVMTPQASQSAVRRRKTRNPPRPASSKISSRSCATTPCTAPTASATSVGHPVAAHGRNAHPTATAPAASFVPATYGQCRELSRMEEITDGQWHVLHHRTDTEIIAHLSNRSKKKAPQNPGCGCPRLDSEDRGFRDFHWRKSRPPAPSHKTPHAFGRTDQSSIL